MVSLELAVGIKVRGPTTAGVHAIVVRGLFLVVVTVWS